MLDLNAPIEPGKGAAGLTLGDLAGKLLEANRPTKRELRHVYEFLDFGPVCVWAREGVIEQIGVRGAYTGRLVGTAIGIGSTIQQVIEAIGPVFEDDEDNLVVADVPGMCFDTESWHDRPGHETIEENLDARVTDIFVFPFD